MNLRLAMTPAEAARIVTDPAAHPADRAAAWCDLKAARAQPVDLDRLCPPPPRRVVPPPSSDRVIARFVQAMIHGHPTLTPGGAA